MKTRTGFVSNSSSSSFIVIDANRGYEGLFPLENPNRYVIGKCGEVEFDWGPEVISDIHSRINFTWLQAVLYTLDEDLKRERLKMLEDCLRENSSIREIESCIVAGWQEDSDNVRSGYIDHQSAASEGANIQMFNSRQQMKDFIFGTKSLIVLDNDNH